MKKEEAFRKWYDERIGTKSESFAWDAWCAAWDAAKKLDLCHCEHISLCNLHDRCMKGQK